MALGQAMDRGALSYLTYLVHWQIIMIVETFLPATALRTAFIVAIVTRLGAALTRRIEEPIDRYRARRRTLPGAVKSVFAPREGMMECR